MLAVTMAMTISLRCADKNERRVEREDERHEVGGDAQAHGGPAGLPEVGMGDGRGDVDGQTVRRRDQ